MAQNFTANVLLALGCVPSMTLSAGEIGAFVARSDALLVNLGTFDRERREATEIAVDTARGTTLPWVLDPVFVDRAPRARVFARELVGARPACGAAQSRRIFRAGGRRAHARCGVAYAREHGLSSALSGETDLVTDGERFAAVANGHALMAKVTAMGCAGSALVAARSCGRAGCLARDRRRAHRHRRRRRNRRRTSGRAGQLRGRDRRCAL